MSVWLLPLFAAVMSVAITSGILGLAVRWLLLSAADRDKVNLGWGSDGTLTRLWALSKEKDGAVRTAIRGYVVLTWVTLILTPIMLIAVFAYVGFGR